MSKEASQAGPVGSVLLPLISALIVDTLVKTVADLPLVWRIVVPLALGIVYAGGYYLIKHPKLVRVSRPALTALTVLFVVAILLILAAAVILGLGLATVALLVGWLVCMMLLLRVARALPVTSVVPKLTLTIVGAASLGAGLSIGGVPDIGFVTQRSVQVSIENRCGTPLVYDPLKVNVPARGTQTIAVPAVAVAIGQEGGQVVVRGAYDRQFRIANPQSATISLDGQVIGPSSSRTFNLWQQPQHKLMIACP